jgi:hypothetical protein
MSGWRIPSKWRFIAGKIIELKWGTFRCHVWLLKGSGKYLNFFPCFDSWNLEFKKNGNNIWYFPLKNYIYHSYWSKHGNRMCMLIGLQVPTYIVIYISRYMEYMEYGHPSMKLAIYNPCEWWHDHSSIYYILYICYIYINIIYNILYIIYYI